MKQWGLYQGNIYLNLDSGANFGRNFSRGMKTYCI